MCGFPFRPPAASHPDRPIVVFAGGRFNYYQSPMTTRDAQPIDSMPPYVVRRIQTDEAAAGSGHHHVGGIDTVDPDGGETHWTLVQVVSAVRDGERFVMGGAEGGRTADLEPAVCPRCRLVTLAVVGEAAKVHGVD